MEMELLMLLCLSRYIIRGDFLIHPKDFYLVKYNNTLDFEDNVSQAQKYHIQMHVSL